jgi:arylsulfatase A
MNTRTAAHTDAHTDTQATGAMTRRDFARLAGLGAGAAALTLTLSAAEAKAVDARAAKARAAERPNIVFIMADDLGYGHPGCYGQQKIKTPNIDRLATEGMRFTDYYAGYTVCAPSRSVLMTGLHHGRTPVRANGGGSSLLESDTTVSQILQRAGYANGGFGKWGLGIEDTPGRPSQKGFDEFWGFYHQVHAHFYYPFWIWRNDEKFMLPGNDNGGREQWVADVLHEKALDFIRASAAKKTPFFCYIPSIVPHVELAAPEAWVAQYRGKFPKETINDGRPGYLGSDDAYAVYAGMIGRLDEQVGEIAALIKTLGIDDNTLVIFTSDNGPQGGTWQPLVEFFNGAGPLSGSKGSLQEGGIRVPFIARWPGKVRAGSTSDHVGGFQDMMPTFAELAGDDPPETDGVSIVPTLLGREDEQAEHPYLYWGGRGTAVRMGKWKGLQASKGGWRLFDLSKDIGETTDLAKDNPEIVTRIEQCAAEAYTPPRKQIASARVGIATYVRGDRITVKNPR